MVIKWKELTPGQRDELVASTIMGNIKPYSTDLRVAFEIVEQLYYKNQGLQLLHGGLTEKNDPSSTWLCRLTTNTRKIFVGHGSAPEAICIAALKAHGVNVTELD